MIRFLREVDLTPLCQAKAEKQVFVFQPDGLARVAGMGMLPEAMKGHKGRVQSTIFDQH
jgi:hypothetical protein